ncbi:MAG: acyl carrier protein [Spirochaetaceae bacterium]|nr:acyl carrier protein [Spirochaetaceae bacterium]
MEQKVIEILQRVFDGYEITLDSSSETIADWDSMHQLNIAFEIESEFGVSLEPDEMTLLKTVKQIVNLLNSKQL